MNKRKGPFVWGKDGPAPIDEHHTNAETPPHSEITPKATPLRCKSCGIASCDNCENVSFPASTATSGSECISCQLQKMDKLHAKLIKAQRSKSFRARVLHGVSFACTVILAALGLFALTSWFAQMDNFWMVLIGFIVDACMIGGFSIMILSSIELFAMDWIPLGYGAPQRVVLDSTRTVDLTVPAFNRKTGTPYTSNMWLVCSDQENKKVWSRFHNFYPWGAMISSDDTQIVNSRGTKEDHKAWRRHLLFGNSTDESST